MPPLYGWWDSEGATATWTDARADCVSRGGYLAFPRTIAEFTSLKAATTAGGSRWIGIWDEDGDGTYLSVTNTELTVEHWHNSHSPVNDNVMKCVYAIPGVARVVSTSDCTSMTLRYACGFIACLRQTTSPSPPSTTPAAASSLSALASFAAAGHLPQRHDFGRCFRLSVVRYDLEDVPSCSGRPVRRARHAAGGAEDGGQTRGLRALERAVLLAGRTVSLGGGCSCGTAATLDPLVLGLRRRSQVHR